MRMTRFEQSMQKRNWMNAAEAAGRVADSKEVRDELIRKLDSGEMTLDEVQAELARIKRDAKKNGKVTRNQAFNGH